VPYKYVRTHLVPERFLSHEANDVGQDVAIKVYENLLNGSHTGGCHDFTYLPFMEVLSQGGVRMGNLYIQSHYFLRAVTPLPHSFYIWYN
jgi:hypothetical protein